MPTGQKGMVAASGPAAHALLALVGKSVNAAVSCPGLARLAPSKDRENCVPASLRQPGRRRACREIRSARRMGLDDLKIPTQAEDLLAQEHHSPPAALIKQEQLSTIKVPVLKCEHSEGKPVYVSERFKTARFVGDREPGRL